jgi:hypothetical protein
MRVDLNTADLFLIAAWAGAAFWALCLAHTVLGALFIRRMPRVEPDENSFPTVKVSIIFAYRDEKAGILDACRSVLAQDHGSIEVIAVDDRSTDGSGNALDELSGDPRLKRVMVRDLPHGWLGKNHALQRGADCATGEWLLFTDADVIFQKDTVRRALKTANCYAADHLALLPHVVLNGAVENLFYRAFGTLFAVRFQPWASRFRRLNGFAGVGAFNMIRRRAYQQIGEHRAIAMDIADDVMLAKRVKDAGLRLMLGSGEDAVSVRWFVGFKGMLNSIRKNSFRGFNYRLDLAIAGAAGIGVCAILPVLCVIVGGSAGVWTAAGVSFGSMVLLQFGFGSKVPQNIFLGLAMPAGLLLFAYVIMVSVWDTWRRQAVIWRGTSYPLKQMDATWL